MVLRGFIEGYILLPFGLAAFVGAGFPTAFMVWVLREVVTVIDRADCRLQTIRRVIPLSPLELDRSLRQGPRSHNEASRENYGEL